MDFLNFFVMLAVPCFGMFAVFFAAWWCINERKNVDTRKDVVSIEKTKVLDSKRARKLLRSF